MPGASLALFADWGACHVQKSSDTICVLPTPFRWGATRFKMLGDHAPIIISIHALRVEGDLRNTVSALTSGISIHALRVEGDDQQQQPFAIVGYFYPRPPGGGRQRGAIMFLRVDYFYPRPPGGGRLLFFMVRVDIFGFLSTPSGWRATSKNGQSFRLFLRKREKNLPL